MVRFAVLMICLVDFTLVDYTWVFCAFLVIVHACITETLMFSTIEFFCKLTLRVEKKKIKYVNVPRYT